MHKIKIPVILLLFQFLLGCAHLSADQKISSEIMPRSAAIQILRSYNLGEFVSLTKSGFCSSDRVNVNISDINSATYSTTRERLIIRAPYSTFCLAVGSVAYVKSVEDAKQVLVAMRALGAKVTVIDLTL
jgi:hypothetical protein